MRRAKAYEAKEKLDMAIAGMAKPLRLIWSTLPQNQCAWLDVKKVIEIAPTFMRAITECARLEKAQLEAQERMKTEVVGALGPHVLLL